MEDKILELIDDELQRAKAKFPAFASGHEGYAVILEEFDEAKAEFSAIKDSMKDFWVEVKNHQDYKEDIERLEYFSLRLIKESIQLAAMVYRFKLDIIK